MRGPTSVSKLNPDNVYSIQSDVATEVWEREGNVSKFAAVGSGWHSNNPVATQFRENVGSLQTKARKETVPLGFQSD